MGIIKFTIETCNKITVSIFLNMKPTYLTHTRLIQIWNLDATLTKEIFVTLKITFKVISIFG